MNALIRWSPVGVFAVTLSLYLATLHPSMPLSAGISTDTAELQRMAYRLGIPHSTGYPFYTLLGFAVMHVGEALGASPYEALNGLSAVLSAGGMAFLYLALAKLAHRALAFVVVMAFACVNSVWHFSTIAEIQGLQLFIVGALLWLCFEAFDAPQARLYRMVQWMAVLGGLGMANHRAIVFYVPLVLSVFWFRRAWEWLNARRVLALAVLCALPIASHAYLYVRAATDPFAPHSTRQTGVAHELDSTAITDLIRGSFSGGAGLENNFSLLTAETFGERVLYIYGRVTGELTVLGFWAGALGLLLLLITRWRYALGVLVVAGATWWLVMAYDADDKSIIYQFNIYIAWAVGLVSLFGLGFLPSRWERVSRVRWLQLALCLPVLALVVTLFSRNLPARAQRGYDEDTRFLEAFARLPKEESVLFTRPWAQEVFAILEYQDRTNDRQPSVSGVFNHHYTIADARNLGRNAFFLYRSWRDRLNLDNGAAEWFLKEFDLAFSATHSPLFFQVRPKDDPRLLAEANAATPLNARINDSITLLGYRAEVHQGALELALYWRADAPPPVPYSVYVHLREYGTLCEYDESRLRMLAQDDAPAPVRGSYPTYLWHAGHVVKDGYVVPLRLEGADTARTAIAIGMVDGYSNQRGAEVCLPLSAFDVP